MEYFLWCRKDKTVWKGIAFKENFCSIWSGYSLQIAGEIAAALPQKLDANRPDSQYESFVGILEDKLFVTRNKDNALTVSLYLFV